MNKKIKVSLIALSSIGLLSPALSFAEVKSLSSSELTETYIKDSTIIVTPKKKKVGTEQKTYSSLTIAPVENSDIDIDQLHHQQQHSAGTLTAVALNDELLRNASVDAALSPELGIIVPTFQELTTRPIAEILDDPRYTVPEGNFDFTYVGGGGSKDLGISRQGDQFTFSIGNLPEISQINLPEGINDGPLQITPRAGGGFDLTINIPENN